MVMVAPALTMEQLEDIQASCLADDIQIDFNRMSLWNEVTARAYFESGGETVVAAAADATGVAPSAAAAAAAVAVAVALHCVALRCGVLCCVVLLWLLLLLL